MKHTSEALLIELMAECTDMLLAGASVAACLARYPEHAAELAPLLNATVRVHTLREVPPRAPETVAHSRAAFMAAARQLAAERARPPQPTLVQLWRDGWQQFLTTFAQAFGGYGTPRALPVGLAAILIVVLLTGLLTTGAITASAHALPGDLLYPVKITTENVAILITRDTETRAELRQQFAERRLVEVKEVLTQGRAVHKVTVSGPLEALGVRTWQVAGLTIEITAQTQIEGAPWVGAMVEAALRAPGDGSLIATYIVINTPQPAPTPTPTPTPMPTRMPTRTPAPTATPTETATVTPEAEPASLALPPEPFFEPTDTPTPQPTPTFTPTATRTLRPTATPTRTPTQTSTPARDVIKERIIGWVNSIEPGYWLIDGNHVEVNDATVFIGGPGVGWRVEAEVERLPADHYLGLRIVAVAPPDYVEPWFIIEDVNAKGGSVWNIGGYAVNIGLDTAIEGDPQVGDTVEVNGERRGGNGYWAKRITTVRAHRYEFFGTVESISDPIWVISGTAVRITAETQLIGSPGIGSSVGVRATINSRNEYIALLIYVATP